MPRRPDERYAVTVSLTAEERAILLTLVDVGAFESTMQLVRALLWNAAEDAGLSPGPRVFERERWGVAGGRNRKEGVRRQPNGRIYYPAPKRERRPPTRPAPGHPWREYRQPQEEGRPPVPPVQASPRVEALPSAPVPPSIPDGPATQRAAPPPARRG